MDPGTLMQFLIDETEKIHEPHSETFYVADMALGFVKRLPFRHMDTFLATADNHFGRSDRKTKRQIKSHLKTKKFTFFFLTENGLIFAGKK